jgi:hypothetical protein
MPRYWNVCDYWPNQCLHTPTCPAALPKLPAWNILSLHQGNPQSSEPKFDPTCACMPKDNCTCVQLRKDIVAPRPPCLCCYASPGENGLIPHRHEYMTCNKCRTVIDCSRIDCFCSPDVQQSQDNLRSMNGPCNHCTRAGEVMQIRCSSDRCLHCLRRSLGARQTFGG